MLRRVEGPTAEIEAGPLRMKIALEEITGVEGESLSPKTATAAAPLRNVTVRSQFGQSVGSGAAGEINIIGMRVEEATQLVDKYLDEAALSNRTQVRIIHGHGTGALRRGLAGFLATHPLVEEIHDEDPERGGSAVTIVELKA